MKIPINWLKEYVDIDISIEELAHKLTMAGLEVVGMEKIAGDTVFEIEVTTNRPDWLGIYGVAREVAAITAKKLKPIDSKLQASDIPNKKIDVKIEDKKDCPRYTARIIDAVKVGPSPEWLVRKIEAVGLRSVNNVVDITNFVLFELGQPLHAFDYDKLSGAKIIVRRAQKGEEFTTIDGEKRTLDREELVIADSDSAVALAGIMGGLNTEVSASTKTILLESACFDPPLIRRTAKRLGLTSESSYRFERRIDLECVALASNRAAALICDICGAKAQKNFQDEGTKKLARKPIALDLQYANSLLGVKIKEAQMEKILKSLGFSTSKKQGTILATPPSYRNDAKKDVDLIEEIARIWGYDNIPVKLPSVIPAHEYAPKAKDKIVGDLARDILVSLGLDEVITYSLIGKAQFDNAKLNQQDAVCLSNPLSSEQGLLRTSLIPTMLECILWNINRKNTDLKLFEIGRVYQKSKQQAPLEENRLCAAITGKRHDDWLRKDAQVNFYDLKGIVEEFLNRLGIAKYKITPSDNQMLSNSASAEITIDGRRAGITGLIKRDIAKAFDLEQDVYILELDLDQVVKDAVLEKKYVPLAKHPSAYRDISIILDQGINSYEITSLIEQQPNVTSVRVFDQYIGEKIPQGKKSLAFSIEYQRKDRTLTDEEVNSSHSSIIKALEEKFSAKLR